MQIRLAALVAPICLLAAWTVGQAAMAAQLGKPHPLRGLADELVAKKVNRAVAEIFDAHLLSYLTSQRCRIAEFEPFWSRLAQYVERPASAAFTQPVDYIVRTAPIPEDGAPWQYPGPPPPETTHPLWPRIRQAIAKAPSLCLLRKPLTGGYEQVRIARPLEQLSTMP